MRVMLMLKLRTPRRVRMSGRLMMLLRRTKNDHESIVIMLIIDRLQGNHTMYMAEIGANRNNIRDERLAIGNRIMKILKIPLP
jgi:predicted neuraminidase